MADPTKIASVLATISAGQRSISNWNRETEKTVLLELTKLLGTQPLRAGSVIDMKATLSTYMDRLAALPADDVMDVIRRFGDSRLGDGHWAPTPGDICREVYALMEKRSAAAREKLERERREAELAEQLASRRRVAENFERRTQMEIDRAKEMVAEFKASLPEDQTKPKGWRPPTEAEAKAWLEAHEGGQGVRPVTEFSPSLVEKLREMRIADDERFADLDAFARDTI
jgi:hypothetical protein